MPRSSLNALVDRIRREQCLTSEVPDFDPGNGNARAKYLFVLEAPGPQAVATGVISFDNPDLTARNFKSQLVTAGVLREDIALWHVVPWYLGNSERTRIRGALASDVKQGLAYLGDVVAAIHTLRCVVLVGAAARQAHTYLSHTTDIRILSCHHPSPKVQNTTRGATEENIAVFRFMQKGAP